MRSRRSSIIFPVLDDTMATVNDVILHDPPSYHQVVQDTLTRHGADDFARAEQRFPLLRGTSHRTVLNPSTPLPSRPHTGHASHETLDIHRIENQAIPSDFIPITDPYAIKQDLNTYSPGRYKPWFLGFMTTLQIVVFGFELLFSFVWSGQVIQTSPSFNVLIGPPIGVSCIPFNT
jgi:hypothetical protein